MTTTDQPPALAAPARFRNIHFSPAPEQPAAVARTAPEQAAAPFEGRLRWVQRSPADEFAARAGEAAPLSPEIAALILFRKERLTCGRDGLAIKIKTDGEGREVTRKYWHENSLCCQPEWLGREVFAAYNRHAPGCLYLFTADGEFIEALPEKGTDDFFAAPRTLEAHRRHQAKVLARLEHLHGDDTQRTLDTAAANSAQLLKVVQTFPHPSTTEPAPRNNHEPEIEARVAKPDEVTGRSSFARDCFAPAPAPDSRLTTPGRPAPEMDEHGRIVPALIATHEASIATRRAAVAAASPADILARRAARAEQIQT